MTPVRPMATTPLWQRLATSAAVLAAVCLGLAVGCGSVPLPGPLGGSHTPNSDDLEDTQESLDMAIHEQAGEAYPHDLAVLIRKRAALTPDPAAWLRDLLHHQEPIARAAAARVLGEVAGNEAIADLRALLTDDSSLVVVDAAQALCTLGDRSGLSPVQALAQQVDAAEVEGLPPEDPAGWPRRLMIDLLLDADDPASQVLAIYLAGMNVGPAGLMKWQPEMRQLDDWSIGYMVPLLDDTRSTGVTGRYTGWLEGRDLRMCDTAALTITDLVPEELDPYGAGARTTEEFDEQIEGIKSWWAANAHKYPPPPAARAAAERVGLSSEEADR